jgi:hypothetical protein
MNSLQAYFERFDWELNNTINDIYETKMGSNFQTYSILHLNDLYIDPLYKTGTSSKCNGPVCCHLDNSGLISEQINPDDVAGEFGHSGCHMPLYGVSKILQAIKLQLEINPSIIVVSGVVSEQQAQLTME